MPPTKARYMPRSPVDLPLHITQVSGFGQAPLNVTTLHAWKRIGKPKYYLSNNTGNGKNHLAAGKAAEKLFGMHILVYASGIMSMCTLSRAKVTPTACRRLLTTADGCRTPRD